MTNNASSLLVAVADRSAIVKVNGRANFTTSITFKRLILELRERGFGAFILDLSDCVTMDSTFLGVLAGTALKLSENGVGQGGDGASSEKVETPRLRLLNPNQRVVELLDNLGVSELFETFQCALPASTSANLAPAEEIHPSREEVSKTCLEAHRILMEVNPDNVAKFKDVAQFLAEDIKKLRAEAEAGNNEASSQPAPCPS